MSKKSFNNLGKIEKELARFSELVSVVSFDETKKSTHSGAASAADVAEINYRGGVDALTGVAKPPARPFIEIAFAIAEQKFADILIEGLDDIVQGKKTAGQVFRKIGDEQKRSLKKVLANGLLYGLENNAESWAKRKGFDSPMRETGEFLSKSIKTRVQKR
jgi:hypothetical protein